MSNQIENRIVEMEFDNKQFEDGVKESLSTLDKLKKALNFKDAAENLESLGKATKNFDLNGIGEAVEKVGDKFSTFRLLGIHALANLVDAAMDTGKKMFSALAAPFNQAKTGGWNRAMNIENAKFQLEGLGVAWEEVAEDINYAVADTAYGLDAAAKAAAQLTASGVEFGEIYGPTGSSPMAKALRGISGVAAMTNSAYEDISQIFTRIAGQGRVMATDLNSLAARGLNAAAILGEQFGVTESEIRELVHKGQIDFEMFSEAMDDAFGEHAKEANRTFTGALENVKAALNKIGQPFATSIMHGAIPVFNEIRLFLNEIRANLGPVFDIFETITSMMSELLSSKISNVTADLQNRFTGLDSISNALNNTLTAILRIIFAISDAFHTVFPSEGGFVDFLNRAAEGAERFSEKLLLDDETLNKLRNTVVVVLSVLKVLFSIAGKIIDIGKAILVNVGLPIIGVLGKIVLFVGDLIYKAVSLASILIRNINIGEKIGKVFGAIGKFFTYLKNSASDISTIFGKIVNGLKNLLMILAAIVAGPIYLIIEGVSYLVTGLSKAANPIEFLKRLFVSLGDKIKEFVSYLKEIPVIGSIISILESRFLRIRDAIVSAFEWFVDLFNQIKSGRSLIDILKDKVKGVSQLMSDLFSSFGDESNVIVKGLNFIKDAALSLAAVITGVLFKGFFELKDLIVGFATTKDPWKFLKDKLTELVSKVIIFNQKLREIPVIGKIIYGLEAAILAVGYAIYKTIAWFQDFGNRLRNGEKFVDVFKSKMKELGSSFDGLKLKVSEFINGHEGLKTALAFITSGFNKAKNAIIEFTTGLKERFKGLTASRVILAAFAAMILIVIFNINELIKALGGLARKMSNGFFNIFKQTPTKFDKFASGMMLISAAIAMVAASFYLLKDVETDKLKEIAKVLATLIGLVAGLSLLATVLVQITGRWGGGDGFIGFASNMFALAAGVAILIASLKLMDTINMDGIWKKIGILGLIAVGLMAVGITMSKLAPKLTTGGFLMIMFSAAILILVEALVNLSKVDLSGIKESWKELTVLILAFGVFAAAASSVGISSVIGLIAFLAALALLFKNYDAVKSQLEKTKIGETLSRFATQLKEELTKVVNNIKDAYESMSQFDKIMLAIYTILSTGSIVLVMRTMSKTAKSIRKTTFSVILLLGAIAGFMALFYAIADMTTTIPVESIKQAEKLLMALGGFILLLMAICSLGTEKSSRSIFYKKNAMNLNKSMSRKSMDGNITSIRKLITSIGLLLLSVAGFMYIIGQVPPDRMEQASIALMGVMGFVAAIAILSSFISKNTLVAGRMAGQFSSFIGIIMMIATLIGSFVVLMYYFDSVNFAEDWPKLVASIVGLGVVIGAIIAIVKTLSGLKKSGFGFSAIIASLGLSVALIGGIIILMVKNIKPDQVNHALKMAGILTAFIAILIGFVIGIAMFTKKAQGIKTGPVRKGLLSISLLLGEIIAAVAIFGLLAIALQKLNIGTGKMIVQLGFLVTLVGAILWMAYGIVKATQMRKIKTDQLTIINKQLRSLMTVFAGLIGAIVIFAGVAFLLQNVDTVKMIAQLGFLTLLIVGIMGLATAIVAIDKKMTAVPDRIVGKVETVMSMIVGLMGVILIIFFAMQKLKDPWKSLKDIQTITLVIVELGILAAACGFIGNMKVEITKGGTILSWMVGLFAVIAIIFKILDSLKSKASRILGISESIVLILLELEVIALLCSALGAVSADIYLGELALAAMVGIFYLLTEVFTIINKLKTKGILAKSESIVLILLELAVIAALCSVLGVLSAAVGLGELTLLGMVGIFRSLTEVFVTIQSINTNGLTDKTNEILKCMMKLIGIAALVGILAGFMLLGKLGSIGLNSVVDVFARLAAIFIIIHSIDTNGITEKTNEIFKCMLKLVGIAALLGIIFPLAALASLGTPAILDMCQAMIMIAKALRGVAKMTPQNIDAILDAFTEALLKVAGIGIVGLIGGPGLMMLAAGIETIGMACAMVAGSLSTFTRSLIDLANVTPKQIETLVSVTKAFFISVGKGLVTLGKAFAVAFVELASGVVEGVNRIADAEPAMEFIYGVLERIIEIAYKAVGASIGLLALGKGIKMLGEGFYYAGMGVEAFGNGVAKITSITPQQITNLKRVVYEFFHETKNGFVEIAKGVRECLQEIGAGLVQLGQDLSNSGEAFETLSIAFWELIGGLAVLAVISPGLLVLAVAARAAAWAMNALVDTFVKISNINSAQIERAKAAVTGMCDAIVSNDTKIKSIFDMMWEIIKMFGSFGAIAVLTSPGILSLAGAIMTIAQALDLALKAVDTFSVSLTNLANMTDSEISNIQKVITAFFDSVVSGVTQLGATLVEQVLAIGQALFTAITDIILGIRNALIYGTTEVEVEAVHVGQSAQNGLVTGLGDASVYGGHFILNFVSGMQSKFGMLAGVCSAGAAIVKAYWGHTTPLWGAMSNDDIWGGHFMDNFIGGITSKLPDLGSICATGAKIVSKNLGLDSLLPGEMFKSGSLMGINLTNGLGSEFGDFSSMVDAYMGQFAKLSNAAASVSPNVTRIGNGSLYEYQQKVLKKDVDAAQAKVNVAEEQLKNMNRAGRDVAKWELERAQTQLDKANEQYKQAVDAYENVGHGATEAAKKVEVLNETMENTGPAAGGAAKEMNNFASELEGVLEGQMDIFSKFEEKEAMSKEELLNNMRSQIEGMTKWANNMSALAAKGIDQGLYEKLAMMGPEGAQYVAAFNEMTAEELAQANNLWAQSLVLPNNVAKQVSASFSNIGLNTMLGWKNGVADEAQAVIDLYRTTGEGSVSATEDAVGTHSPSTIFYAIGMYCMLGLRDGIKQYMRLPIDALKFVCGQMIDDAKKMLDPQIFYQVGVNLIDGLTAGLTDEEAMKRLIAALEALVASIKDFAEGKDGADSHSPSKKTAKLGRYLVEGLAVGLKENAGIAGEAAESLAADTVETMKETIAGVAKNLLEDDEFTPVITPVLDLTNVTTGAKQLNSLFTTNQAISAMASMNNLQNAQQIDPNNPNSRFGTTFIQNNYSPKALNRMEIYRQTRNQFAQYKEAML